MNPFRSDSGQKETLKRSVINNKEIDSLIGRPRGRWWVIENECLEKEAIKNAMFLVCYELIRKLENLLVMKK